MRKWLIMVALKLIPSNFVPKNLQFSRSLHSRFVLLNWQLSKVWSSNSTFEISQSTISQFWKVHFQNLHFRNKLLWNLQFLKRHSWKWPPRNSVSSNLKLEIVTWSRIPTETIQPKIFSFKNCWFLISKALTFWYFSIRFFPLEMLEYALS